MKEFRWDCIAFHDVDLVPLDARCPYTCNERPTILATAAASHSSVALISRNQFFEIDGFATRPTPGAAAGRSAPHPALRSTGASRPAPFDGREMGQLLTHHDLLPLITPPADGHCVFMSTESAKSLERRQRRERRVRDGASPFASDAAGDSSEISSAATQLAVAGEGMRQNNGARDTSYTLRDSVHHALFTRWRFSFDAAASHTASPSVRSAPSRGAESGAVGESARSGSAAASPAAPARRVAVEKATEAMVKILKLRDVRTGAELDAMTPNEVRDVLKVEAIEALHDREHRHMNMWDVTDADLLFLANKLGVAWQQSDERWGV